VLADPGSEALAVAETWADTSGFDPGGTELEGFQARWLDKDSAFSAFDVDRVLRHAYRAALDLAGAKTPVLPIETFWVRGAGDEFEVHIHEGIERITMFMFLPVVRNYGSLRAETRSFVVRVGDLDDLRPDVPRQELDGAGAPVLMIQVSGPYPEAG
jgi:hypothetical protein